MSFTAASSDEIHKRRNEIGATPQPAKEGKDFDDSERERENTHEDEDGRFSGPIVMLADESVKPLLDVRALGILALPFHICRDSQHSAFFFFFF